jgi:hypothetical protein
MKHYTMAQLPGMVGKELALSDWLIVDQDRIQRIAEAGTDRIAAALSQRASELIRENAGIAADALADRLKSEISCFLIGRKGQGIQSL